MTATPNPKVQRPLIIRGDAHTPSDLVKWGKNGPARGEPPGPRPTPAKEAWA